MSEWEKEFDKTFNSDYPVPPSTINAFKIAWDIQQKRRESFGSLAAKRALEEIRVEK